MPKKIDFDPNVACNNLFIQDQIALEQDLEKNTRKADKKTSQKQIGEEKKSSLETAAKETINKKVKLEKAMDTKIAQVVYLPKPLCKQIRMRTVLSEKKCDRSISSLVETAVKEYLLEAKSNEM